MPYRIIKVKGGYKVQNTQTFRTYSLNPMTKENALRQFCILRFNL